MSYDPESDAPVTDVLAAEEFGVPSPHPALTPEELDLPRDLVGDLPRDVLAAEEFAMPAPDEARVSPGGGQRRPPFVRLVAIYLPALLGALWLWRRTRHRVTPAAETEPED